MKIFKLLAVAFVAMLSFSSCDQHECEDFGYDHSADLVGTWTCLQENFAEALVISADGKVVSTGVAFGEYWENVEGKIEIKNCKATMTFEDGDDFEGHFDIIPGMAFSIYNEEGRRFTYNYCANDLSDEIVGMWVCNEGTATEEDGIAIHTYTETGKTYLTTATSAGTGDFALNEETEYKVIGNLMFLKLMHKTLDSGVNAYAAVRLTYTPNATSAGDIMTLQHYLSTTNGFVEEVNSFLRIKDSLDLPGKKYDYIKTFVTNVDGLDQDIDFMGYTFNFAKMDGTTIDQMLKALLFSVEFPSANKIKYSCRFSSGVQTVEAPIAVDGNKMTLKMSELYPTAKDVDLYTFQDADCSQMHMYMPTYAFINFFGNMQVIMMSQLGQLDTNNAEAVKAVFDSIDDAVNTINVSFVMEKAAK